MKTWNICEHHKSQQEQYFLFGISSRVSKNVIFFSSKICTFIHHYIVTSLLHNRLKSKALSAYYIRKKSSDNSREDVTSLLYIRTIFLPEKFCTTILKLLRCLLRNSTIRRTYGTLWQLCFVILTAACIAYSFVLTRVYTSCIDWWQAIIAKNIIICKYCQ